MECSKHPNESIVMVCDSCNKDLLCLECMDDHADSHKFVSIKKVIGSVQDRLRERLSDNETNILKLKETLGEARRQQTIEETLNSDGCESFENQRQMLHEVVDNLTDALIEVHRNQSGKTLSVLKDLEQDLTSRIKKLNQSTKEINDMLQNKDFKETFKQYRMLKPPRNMGMLHPAIKSHKFNIGTINERQLQDMIGKVVLFPDTDSNAANENSSLETLVVPKETSVQSKASADEQPSLQELPHERSNGTNEDGSPLSSPDTADVPEETSSQNEASRDNPPSLQEGTYVSGNEIDQSQSSLESPPESRVDKPYRDYELSLVMNIACREENNFADDIIPSSKGHCWTRWTNQKEVKLLDKNGNVKQRLKFSKRILGFTLTSGNRLLICGTEEKCIYQVVYGFAPSVYFRIGLYPMDICYVDSMGLAVTVVDDGDYKTTDASKRMVQMYSKKGKVTACAEYDQFGDRIFITPGTLCVNKNNNDVAVINRTSDASSHLVILDKSLNLKLRYVGGGHVVPADGKYYHVTDAKFAINGVCFDQSGNILISESYSKSIQLLSDECKLLKTVWNDALVPGSLALNTDGDYWCCFEKKNRCFIKIFSAK